MPLLVFQCFMLNNSFFVDSNPLKFNCGLQLRDSQIEREVRVGKRTQLAAIAQKVLEIISFRHEFPTHAKYHITGVALK